MDIISDTTARDIEKWARSTLPVYEFMDLKILSCSDGTYSCRVALGENTGNHVGTIHAAFQWAAAEFLGGLVVLANRSDEKYVPVVKSLTIQFIRPARSDITSAAFFSSEHVARMNAALAESGRYDFELDSTIRGSDGALVAKATGCFAVRIMDREPTSEEVKPSLENPV